MKRFKLPLSEFSWSKDDYDLVKRTVKAYNARLKRYQSQYPDTVHANKLTTAEIVGRVDNRRDLTRELKIMGQLNADTAKPVVNKQGVSYSKFALAEAKRKMELENQRRRALIEKETIYSGTVGTVRQQRMRPIADNFDKVDTRLQAMALVKKIDKAYSPVEKSVKNDQYKDNYIDTYKKVLHDDEFAELLDGIPSHIMGQALYDNRYLQLQFIYPGVTGIDDRVATIRQEWSDYLIEQWNDENKEWITEYFIKAKAMGEDSDAVNKFERHIVQSYLAHPRKTLKMIASTGADDEDKIEFIDALMNHTL